ncbi:hypothetical protein C8R46DRAFT_183824 [Mycena filopes]|nr:hypothetical protein C8R46DRAFT_183824 [Mycena filopes]
MPAALPAIGLQNVNPIAILLTLAIVALGGAAFLLFRWLRTRKRHRHRMESNLPWHFPILNGGRRASDRPPALPLAVRNGGSASSLDKPQSFSRFSWFVSEDKLLSTRDSDLKDAPMIKHPERAFVTHSRRSSSSYGADAPSEPRRARRKEVPRELSSSLLPAPRTPHYNGLLP